MKKRNGMAKKQRGKGRRKKNGVEGGNGRIGKERDGVSLKFRPCLPP